MTSDPVSLLYSLTREYESRGSSCVEDFTNSVCLHNSTQLQLGLPPNGQFVSFTVQRPEYLTGVTNHLWAVLAVVLLAIG